ncbi:MAG: hypothetical protein AAF960_23715, partial [Bacteroidota bacterium]
MNKKLADFIGNKRLITTLGFSRFRHQLLAELLSSLFANFTAFIFWQKIQFFAQNFPPSKGARGMLSGNFARNIPLTP